MVYESNECVDCGLPCMGQSCPNRHVLHYECDRCKKEVYELRVHDGEEICIHCYEEAVKNAVCADCGADDEMLKDVDGEYICLTCAWARLEEVEK